MVTQLVTDQVQWLHNFFSVYKSVEVTNVMACMQNTIDDRRLHIPALLLQWNGKSSNAAMFSICARKICSQKVKGGNQKAVYVIFHFQFIAKLKTQGERTLVYPEEVREAVRCRFGDPPDAGAYDRQYLDKVTCSERHREKSRGKRGMAKTGCHVMWCPNGPQDYGTDR